MRAPGPPLRFLLAIVLLWIGGRAAILSQAGEEVAVVAAADAPGRSGTRPTRTIPPDRGATLIAATPPAAPSRAARAFVSAAPGGRAGAGRTGIVRAALQAPESTGRTVGLLPMAERPAPAPQFPGEPARARVALAGAAAPPAEAPGPKRWSGSLFLFGRGGGGAVPLAGGGQLGASQAGARVAYRIDEAGHLAAAARVYAPIDALSGSEAAIGIDLHPLPAAPLRVSIERRIAIGREGRDAWSAYAAGGFFKGIGRSIEVDGYAQAGVVGIRARDLFADGAVRVARRFDLGRGRAVLAGAGVWGAAQPGVERVDVGPRVALRLPAGGTAISIAGEWRARVAGSARPRSGPALTIAADF